MSVPWRRTWMASVQWTWPSTMVMQTVPRSSALLRCVRPVFPLSHMSSVSKEVWCLTFVSTFVHGASKQSILHPLAHMSISNCVLNRPAAYIGLTWKATWLNTAFCKKKQQQKTVKNSSSSCEEENSDTKQGLVGYIRMWGLGNQLINQSFNQSVIQSGIQSVGQSVIMNK